MKTTQNAVHHDGQSQRSDILSSGRRGTISRRSILDPRRTCASSRSSSKPPFQITWIIAVGRAVACGDRLLGKSYFRKRGTSKEDLFRCRARQLVSLQTSPSSSLLHCRITTTNTASVYWRTQFILPTRQRNEYKSIRGIFIRVYSSRHTPLNSPEGST